MESKTCRPKYQRYFLLLPILILLSASHAEGQQQIKCLSGKTDRTISEYRIGQINRTVTGPPTLVMQISVKPKLFNNKDMVALAQQLKSIYCNETRLGVYIFDYYPAAKTYSGIADDNPTYTRDQLALRGFYRLDRAKGEEHITFSTKRNRPIDETKIRLDSSTKP